MNRSELEMPCAESWWHKETTPNNDVSGTMQCKELARSVEERKDLSSITLPTLHHEL